MKPAAQVEAMAIWGREARDGPRSRPGGDRPGLAFGLNLAPDQIGAILAVTAVVLGLITRSRVSPA
jgi:hypothetical protein